MVQEVFVRKARPSWVKLKRHEWKRLRGFIQPNKQTNKQTTTNKQTNKRWGEPARQLVDNANLSWTWSALWEVFVLKAGPSWVKLKRHKWKRLRVFTVRVLFNQTNKQRIQQTNKARLCQYFLKGLYYWPPCGSLLIWQRYYPTIYLCLPLS